MRILVTICAFALLALQINAGMISKKTDKRSTTNDVIGTCEKESTLTSEEAGKYFAEDFLPEDNEGVTALIGCIGDKTGIIDSKGIVDYTKVVDLIVSIAKDSDTDALTEKLMKFALLHATHTCRDSVKQLATPGQTVTRVFNCVKKESKGVAETFFEGVKNAQACVGLNGLSKDGVNKQYKAGDIPDEDHNMIVLFSCLGKVLGLVDSKKAVNYEDIKELLTLAAVDESDDTPLASLIVETALDEAIKSCKKEPVQRETTEQILLHTFNCIFKEMNRDKH